MEKRKYSKAVATYIPIEEFRDKYREAIEKDPELEAMVLNIEGKKNDKRIEGAGCNAEN